MADGIELFKLWATLGLDTTDFNKDIGDAKRLMTDTGGGAESWVTKLSSGLNVISKISSGVVGTIKTVASTGMSLVETSAGMNALKESTAAAFKGIEKEADAAFARVGETNNIAKLRLQQSGLSFFRQFTSAGMTEAEALVAMENALNQAADAAAAYDISLEDASSMLRSFLRGNVEAGESIGLFVNQTTRDNLAGTLFDGAKWEDLTEKQRQFALLTHTNSSYVASSVFGQGAREAKNWTNVVGNLTSAWQKASAIMGEGIMKALIPALESLTKWINDNPAIFEGIGETLGHIATAMVNAFQSLLTFISTHEDDILNFINGLNALFSGEKNLAQVLFGGSFSNTPKPVVTDDEKRAAAMAWLTGEGLYRDAEAAFGKGNSALKYLSDKFAANDNENVTAEVAAQWIDEAFASLQSDLNAENFTANVSIDAVMGKGWDWLVSGANWLGRSLFGDRPGENEGAKFNAKGLDYVPYDNYVTRLHRGETILSRVEAENWRANAKDFGRGADPEAIGSAVKAALAGVSVTMDGRSVGTLVTPYVSREQKAEYWRNR